MAHRALVAYERPDCVHTDGRNCFGRSAENGPAEPFDDARPPVYDLHRSRWGGTDLSLARRITAEAPFGGERTGAARVRRGPSPGSSPRPVERHPVSTGLDFDAVVDAVDFRQHEALFVVAASYDTTAYLPLWFGLSGVADVVDAGALVAADTEGGPYGGPRLRRWFRATKAVVADAVAAGAFSRDEAVAYLAERVREHVGERREVIVRG